MSRNLVALALACSLITIAPLASASPANVHGPWLLVSLAALGTVAWRCDPNHHPGAGPGLPALGLDFRPFADGQSGSVRLSAHGRTVLTRTIEPGRPIRFPYLQARTQQLRIEEGGEDGTLRALVTVDFAPHYTSPYCFSYMPPEVEVRLDPRH